MIETRVYLLKSSWITEPILQFARNETKECVQFHRHLLSSSRVNSAFAGSLGQSMQSKAADSTNYSLGIICDRPLD